MEQEIMFLIEWYDNRILCKDIETISVQTGKLLSEYKGVKWEDYQMNRHVWKYCLPNAGNGSTHYFPVIEIDNEKTFMINSMKITTLFVRG